MCCVYACPVCVHLFRYVSYSTQVLETESSSSEGVANAPNHYRHALVFVGVFFFILMLCMCGLVLAWVLFYHIRSWCSQKAEEGVRVPETGIKSDHKP